MVEAHQDRFSGPMAQSRALYTRWGEGDLAEALRKIADEHGTVSIGSYPNTSWRDDGSQEPYKVKLVCTSRDESALAAAVKAIQTEIECISL